MRTDPDPAVCLTVIRRLSRHRINCKGPLPHGLSKAAEMSRCPREHRLGRASAYATAQVAKRMQHRHDADRRKKKSQQITEGKRVVDRADKQQQ